MPAWASACGSALANQRTVLRMLELPPVTDRKELDAAVRFQAEDQVPMPLASRCWTTTRSACSTLPTGRASA